MSARFRRTCRYDGSALPMVHAAWLLEMLPAGPPTARVICPMCGRSLGRIDGDDLERARRGGARVTTAA